MAFTSTLTAAIGLATKLSHLNEVFQNTKWLKDKVLGDGAEGSGATGHIHPPSYTGALEVEIGANVCGDSVTFTAAFSSWPAVCVTPVMTASYKTAVKNVTTTGFDIVYDAGAQGNVRWIAMVATKNA